VLEVGYKTDRGKVRKNNEDAFHVDERKGLFIVADGMGGHEAGEVASRMAVERIKEYFDSSSFFEDEEGIILQIKEIVKKANSEVYKYANWYETLKGMGTTLVLALIRGERLYIAHVGDSRAYLLRDGKLSRLTEDHSLVVRMVKEGEVTEEEARDYPYRHVIDRALGVKSEVEIDVDSFPYKGEPLLLCTDGLTDMLEDVEIEEMLKNSSNPQETCEKMIEKANEKGGRDNITVVLVREKQ
jgi:protein phosphatase